MEKTQDSLYKRSSEGQNFVHLMDIILSENNIKLAYRNIKRNNGSKTPGTDGLTITDLEKLSVEQIIKLVQNALTIYKPKPVKRVYIPKSDGKERPLGIPTIEDRLIQQCFLQVLEPIAEAKFHNRSYGFRPMRSAKHAMATFYRYTQIQHLHYIVDVDIKGFFDNIPHGILLKKLWKMGIHDKKVISIISSMLKAEVANIGFPQKGTPQGGIISPLLANIILNELDWWVSNQWQTVKTSTEFAKTKQRNGTITESSKYNTLRSSSNLKEGWIVRYADDFKICCRSYAEAIRWYHQTVKWLKQNLQLEVNEEKSQVVNLLQSYSNFLGLKVKLVRKGVDRYGKPKYVVESHISDKSLKRIEQTIKRRTQDLIKGTSDKNFLSIVGSYNAAIIGIHNYYNMATHICKDLNRIGYNNIRTIEKRLHTKLKRYTPTGKNKYIEDKYGQSSLLKELHGHPLVPISYIQTSPPMMLSIHAKPYIKSEREQILNNYDYLNTEVLRYMMRNPIEHESIEYNDNRLSLYCGQKGKCYVTKEVLEIGDIHCHHKIPKSLNGTDAYSNLALVKIDVHKLIHATKQETILSLIKKLGLNKQQINKVNNFRKLAQLEIINV